MGEVHHLPRAAAAVVAAFSSSSVYPMIQVVFKKEKERK